MKAKNFFFKKKPYGLFKMLVMLTWDPAVSDVVMKLSANGVHDQEDDIWTVWKEQTRAK